MKILMMASRTAVGPSTRALMRTRLLALRRDPLPTILHGNGDGGDQALVSIAQEIGFPTELIQVFGFDWTGRNQKLIDQGPICVIVFWDGSSPTTFDLIQQALRARIPLEVYPVLEIPCPT